MRCFKVLRAAAIAAFTLASGPAWAEPPVLFTLKSTDTRKWGAVDGTGAWVIPPKYDYAVEFNEGVAPARQGRQAGYLDPSGNWALDPVLEQAAPFSEGRAAVKQGGNWGYITRDFNWAIKPTFSYAGQYKDGFAIVRFKRDWGVINQTEWAVPPKYDKVRAC